MVGFERGDRWHIARQLVDRDRVGVDHVERPVLADDEGAAVLRLDPERSDTKIDAHVSTSVGVDDMDLAVDDHREVARAHTAQPGEQPRRKASGRHLRRGGGAGGG